MDLKMPALLLLAVLSIANAAEPLAEIDGVECVLDLSQQKRSKAVKDAASGLSILLELSTKPSKVDGGNCEVEWTIVAGSKRYRFESKVRDGMELRFGLLSLPVKMQSVVARMERFMGDWGEDELAEVDVVTGVTRRIGLEAMRAQLESARPKCQFVLNAMGLRSDGLVSVEAYPNEDLAPGEKTCMPEKRWIFDPRTKTARPLK